MRDFLEIQLFKLTKRIIFKGWGYCDKDDRQPDCACCQASDVQDWLQQSIDLIRDF